MNKKTIGQLEPGNTVWIANMLKETEEPHIANVHIIDIEKSVGNVNGIQTQIVFIHFDKRDCWNITHFPKPYVCIKNEDSNKQSANDISFNHFTKECIDTDKFFVSINKEDAVNFIISKIDDKINKLVDLKNKVKGWVL